MLVVGTMLATLGPPGPPGRAAAQPTPAGGAAEKGAPLGFFVTSVGIGDGGNLGGLAGADRHCQTLAAAAGAGGRTWRAYLSTQGPGAVNARDRIGPGPWYNARAILIARNPAELHGDPGTETARIGPNITKQEAVNEKGQTINGRGDPPPNGHDMLTGSQPDGRAFPPGVDRTCQNWTSNGTGYAQVGHHDRTGGGNTSWNSGHSTMGCSQESLRESAGLGLFYCFAAN
jgi:hypothetical protein